MSSIIILFCLLNIAVSLKIFGSDSDEVDVLEGRNIQLKWTFSTSGSETFSLATIDVIQTGGKLVSVAHSSSEFNIITNADYSKRKWTASRSRSSKEIVLNVKDAKTEDDGSYYLKLIYSSSTQLRGIRLNVLVKPHYPAGSYTQNLDAVDEGSKVTLKCKPEGSPQPIKIVWEKNNVRYLETDTTKGSDLVFNNVSRSDIGKYVCKASNKAGSADEEPSVQLTVRYKPVNTKFNTTEALLIGKTVTLHCSADADPVARFSFTGAVAPVSNSETGKIKVKLEASIDGRIVSCTPFNRLGNGPTVDFVIDIKVPAKVTDLPDKLRAIEGRNVSITCKAKGKPAAKIIWLKDGTPRKYTPPHYITGRLADNTYQTVSTLILPFASRDDNGNYVCQAQNLPYGSHEKAVKLNLMYLPEVKNKNDFEQREVRAGDDVTLKCEAHGNPATTYHIWRWENGTVLQNRSKGDLQILNIEPHQGGRLSCAGGSYIGEGKKEYINLLVRVPPMIIVPPQPRVFLNESKRLLLFCNASGVPKPKIHWIKDGALLRYTGDYFSISYVDYTDKGLYTCTADNGIPPNVSASSEVIIYSRPVITTTSATDTLLGAESGEVVKLVCIADALPVSKFKWFSYPAMQELNESMTDIISIQSSSETSLTMEVRARFGAKYLCYAYNNRGNDTQIYEIRPKDFSVNMSRKVQKSLVQNLVYLCAAIYLMISSGVYAKIEDIIVNVGDTATMHCNMDKPIWVKNGTELKKTARVKPSSSYLHLFCVELSDGGIYECRNELNAYKPRQFNLTVNNPDNKEFFQIYNKEKDKCLSNILSSLHLEDCNKHNCRQKWMRGGNGALMSGLDFTCISTTEPVVSGKTVKLENCLNRTTQEWKCHHDLLTIPGHDLYLNCDSKENIVFSSMTGPGSRWVKYTTRDNICSENRKVVIDRTHVILAERGTVKVKCKGINFFKPTYSWLKNGEHINGKSGLSLHIYSNVLFFPFADITSFGNYTCVVKDQWETATASTIIEVYKDPSIIRHSLNQSALFGKDVCLTCQMFANKTSPEIIWSKMGTPIPQGNPKYQINRVSTPGIYIKKFSTELCIKSVNYGDAGIYSCEIKYTSKLAQAQGKLQVMVKPEVTIYIIDGLLVCNATGFPPPSLIWYKDSKYVEKSKKNERSLSIKKTIGNFTCVAFNSAGTSSRSFIPTFPAGNKSDGTSHVTLIIILCVVGGILLGILVILCVCLFCRRKKEIVNNNSEGVYHSVRYTATPAQSTSQSEYTTVDVGAPHQKPHISFKPRKNLEPGPKQFGLKAKYQSLKPRAKGEWEIPYECVKFDKKLGEGQFGQVWKADILARKGSRTVAVKMLREGASIKDRKALIDELEFMKTMSPHPNIVGLVGCCTRSETVMIVVEYVPGGNLKDYLLYSRGNTNDVYSNLAPFSATLTSKDLLTFAYQIARGMSYLEQIKCVHRDLAARNILVGDDKTCKIADFGLARDIYAENYYRKTNGGRLPLRWMAYESIFNGITTNQSDAWSFGVVLWEIVTLGGNPYPDLNRDEVIDGLQRGYRMPKPHHCSDEVYSVMWDCWQQNPDKRPTFAELTATFLRLISLQQNFISTESFGDDDYVNVGSYEETADE
ncbi:hemicentin-1-like isoform X1 [Dendronephthya gigantea]|uniref:hemicentin-1-like isoform X1 n=1 Tax=Dendronephthya gigantea TaxID=151771 RepID=UPI0010691952|nr:hemicentin-1-like isoform X1 [Dendronephthya gigantea]